MNHLLHVEEHDGMPQIEQSSLPMAHTMNPFEESKDGQDMHFKQSSDVVLSDGGRRIRDPLSDSVDRMKMIIGSRRDYYSAMIQKTLAIIREYEKGIEEENREVQSYMKNHQQGNDAALERQFD